MTCRESVSLGAYVLGALEPVERSAMERHLAGCGSCRDELLSFAPLPGLLRHTPFEELPEICEPVGDLPSREYEEVPTSVAFEPFGARPYGGRASGAGSGRAGAAHAGARPGRGSRAAPDRPPRRRWLIAMGAAGAAACASAVYLTLGPPSGGEQPRNLPVAASTLAAEDPDTRVSASAALTPKAWGTSVELVLSGLPKNVRCTMVVHSRTGRTETAGSWASGHYNRSTVPTATSVKPDDVVRIDIVSDEGDLLVSLPRVRTAQEPG